MKFQSKTEEQIKKERLIPDGIYPFEVFESKDGVSKKGNDMIVLNLLVFMEDGTQRQMTDFLMEAMLYKLLHFCRETGLGALYEQGTLQPEDCQGKTGYLKIVSQIRKDTGEMQNSVKDYVPNPKQTTIPGTGPTDEQLSNKQEVDSDIPF